MNSNCTYLAEPHLNAPTNIFSTLFKVLNYTVSKKVELIKTLVINLNIYVSYSGAKPISPFTKKGHV